MKMKIYLRDVKRRHTVFLVQERADGEMLVVAAAVGVASCFGAPISGESAP